MLFASGCSVTVLDHDPDQVELLRLIFDSYATKSPTA
jgi:hypothetical protein